MINYADRITPIDLQKETTMINYADTMTYTDLQKETANNDQLC